MFAKTLPEEFLLVLRRDTCTIIAIREDKPSFGFLNGKIHAGHMFAMTKRIFHQVVKDLLQKGICKNLHTINSNIDLYTRGFQLADCSADGV